jgi:GntR family transcriptional regulator, rspAB operon transcriptional repressor
VVTSYSRQDLLEIYELRELLENAAVRAAAGAMTEQDRAHLDRISRESRRLQSGQDSAKLAALISEFDAVLFAQVRNHRIQTLIENLRAHLTRIGQLTAEIPGRIDASVDEHEKIVEAIAARNPDLAERYMSEHIRSVRDDQLRALEEAADHA